MSYIEQILWYRIYIDCDLCPIIIVTLAHLIYAQYGTSIMGQRSHILLSQSHNNCCIGLYILYRENITVQNLYVLLSQSHNNCHNGPYILCEIWNKYYGPDIAHNIISLP